MGYVKQRSFSIICGIYCLPIVVILAFLALYYFYIEHQKEQFSQYFLRQLSITGFNVRESIEILRTNLANSVISNDYYSETAYGFKKPEDENKTKDDSKSSADPDVNEQNSEEKKAEAPDDNRKDYIIKQLSLISSLDHASISWGEGPPEQLFLFKNNVKVNFLLAPDKKGYNLRARVSKTEKIEDDNQSESYLFEINVALEKLVAPLLPDDVFKNFNGCIVVAREGTEKVLLETGLNLQLIALPKEYPDLSKKDDIKAEEGDTRFLPVRNVEIGLNKYKLFLHPFRCQVNQLSDRGGISTSPKNEDIWLVGALIPESTFLSNPTFAIRQK